jgi:hypothetical protein
MKEVRLYEKHDRVVSKKKKGAGREGRLILMAADVWNPVIGRSTFDRICCYHNHSLLFLF